MWLYCFKAKYILSIPEVEEEKKENKEDKQDAGASNKVQDEPASVIVPELPESGDKE